MVTTQTTNKKLNTIEINDPNWGPPTNTNMTLIDQILGNPLAIAAVGGTTVLTSTQLQNMCIKFTGALSSDARYNLPTGVSGAFIIINATTGPWKLIIGSAGGGTTVSVPQGVSASVYVSNSGGVGGAVYINTPLSNSSADAQVLYNVNDDIVGSPELKFTIGTGLIVKRISNIADGISPVVSSHKQSVADPVVGIGGSYDMYVETAPGVDSYAMSLSATSTAISSGAESFDFELFLMNLGALVKKFVVTSNGQVSGGSVYGSWIATLAEAQALISPVNDKIMTPLRVTQMIYAHEKLLGPFAITSAGLITSPHGFSEYPQSMQLVLVCTSPEFGWGINDSLYLGPNCSASDADRINSIWADTVNCYVRYSSAAKCFAATYKTTGVATALTNSKWQMYLQATL